jgi:Alpha-tubulin suppressor and related RCC1 domain-containing proteins
MLGGNAYGQLGVGDTTNRYTPVIVANIGTTLPRAVAIATGYGHTCALLEDGRVACWGLNSVGQLGVGDTTNRTTPVIVKCFGGEGELYIGNIYGKLTEPGVVTTIFKEVYFKRKVVTPEPTVTIGPEEVL